MLQNSDRLISDIDRLTLLVALKIALFLALGYSGLTYMQLAEHVETKARTVAAHITDLVSGNPTLWVSQVDRLESLLARDAAMVGGETVSAFDANGVFLARAGIPLEWPLLRRSHPIYDSGRVVGRVEIEHSLRSLIVRAAFAALLGGLLGGTVYVAFHQRPLRTLRRMGAALEAEQTALRESEANYRTLIEWSPESITVHRGGKLIYVNPAAIRLFGATSAQDLIGKTMLDLVHPDFQQISRARLKNLEEHGVNAPLIVQRFFKLDGTEMDVEVQGIRILFNGQPAIHVAMCDITERKSVQEALRESEDRFRAVWESSADGMRLCDTAGKMVSVNVAYASMVGKPIKALIGKSLAESYSAEEGERILQAFTKNVAAQSIDEYVEKELTLWNSNKRWFGVSNSFLSSLGDSVLVLSIFRDISERKQAELALAAAQRHTAVLAQLGRELAEATTPKVAAIHILEALQQLLQWDSGWLHLSDETQQNKIDLVNFDLIDGEIREVFPDMSGAQTPARMARRVKEEGPQLLLRDAESEANADVPVYGSGRRSLSLMFVPIQLGGRFIGILSIQSYQHHAYDHADLALLQSLATHCAGALVRLQSGDALRVSDQRFRDLVDSTDGIVWEADATTFAFSFVSRNAVRLLGYPVSDWLQPGFWASHIHPEDRDEAVQYCVACTGRFEDHEFEYRFIAEDGRVVWLRDIVKVVEENGKPRWLRGLMLDITERKQAEAANASLEARLRESQKMEAIGTLAGGIAHDFNNIIATILGNAELARQDVSANPVALESLEEIRKAGSRARDLVQQILSFSRRQPTKLKPTALAPLVQESVRLLRATLPARITLEVHCDAAVPTVRADANQIQQILINLVTNAMQAMPGGPGHIGIRLDTVMLDATMAEAHPALAAMHVKHPGRTLRLAVSDNGPGMDAATLERIFEPFFTTKPVDEGTGLGLAVVHGIVETHEGEIEVASQPGRGTTFTIYLPVAAAAETTAAEPEERAAAIAAPSSAVGGRHILYLDDDESLVFLVKRLLERRGFRISGFVDQRKALDALNADAADFDLVVTDYNMPGMSGLDVAREVRSIRPDLAVAVASGFIDETLRAQADGAGVRELIFKANAVEELCEAFVRLAETLGEHPGRG